MAMPFFMMSRMQLFLLSICWLFFFRDLREFSKEKLRLFNYDVEDGEVVMGICVIVMKGNIL